MKRRDLGSFPTLAMGRNLFVKLRRLLEGSPFLAIVAEDDELDLFVLDGMEKLAGAGNKVRFVVVLGAGFTLHRGRMLHPNGINREQGTTGLRQAQQNGLLVRSMAAGFEESKARKKLRVAIDACVSKARMPAAGAFVVLAPDGRASGPCRHPSEGAFYRRLRSGRKARSQDHFHAAVLRR